MTTQAFEQFRSQVSTNPALQAAVAACFTSATSSDSNGSNGFTKLAALGKSHGFDFTEAQARQATAAGTATLSDFELELVSGGNSEDTKRKLFADHPT